MRPAGPTRMSMRPRVRSRPGPTARLAAGGDPDTSTRHIPELPAPPRTAGPCQPSSGAYLCLRYQPRGLREAERGHDRLGRVGPRLRGAVHVPLEIVAT